MGVAVFATGRRPVCPLENEAQERIASKLDEVVSSEWRGPKDFLEPVTNSPFEKLRVGDY